MGDRKRQSGKPNVHELLARLAAEESEFLRREFLAPALRGVEVQERRLAALTGQDVS